MFLRELPPPRALLAIEALEPEAFLSRSEASGSLETLAEALAQQLVADDEKIWTTLSDDLAPWVRDALERLTVEQQSQVEKVRHLALEACGQRDHSLLSRLLGQARVAAAAAWRFQRRKRWIADRSRDTPLGEY